MAPTNSRRRRAGESEAVEPDAPALLQGGTITALAPQVKRPDRRSLFVDAAFVCGLPEAVIQELGWRVGQHLSAGELAAGMARAQVGAARDEVLRYLAAAPRSRAELLRRLERRGYAAEVAEATVAWLLSRGLIDDAALARQWAESLSTGHRKLGQTAAKAKLLARGIDAATADAAVRAAYGSGGELTAARGAAAQALRRLVGLERPVAQRRLAGSLQRRGFGYELIRQVLRETFDGDE